MRGIRKKDITSGKKVSGNVISARFSSNMSKLLTDECITSDEIDNYCDFGMASFHEIKFLRKLRDCSI